jgi:hypothetical protein
METKNQLPFAYASVTGTYSEPDFYILNSFKYFPSTLSSKKGALYFRCSDESSVCLQISSLQLWSLILLYETPVTTFPS